MEGWGLGPEVLQAANPALTMLRISGYGQGPARADNAGRVARVQEIDAANGAWASGLPSDQVLQALERAAVAAGRLYTIADIAADPHYAACGDVSSVRRSGRCIAASRRPATCL